MTTLLCVRVDAEPNPVAGSVIVQCDNCGCDVWASQASLLAITSEHDDGGLLCFDCVPAEENLVMRSPTKAQLDEVRRELRRGK